MNQLEVCIFKEGNSDPDSRITLPISVLRANPKLLPKDISAALEAQGVPVSELVSLEGVEGQIMDIAGEDSRITISILSGNTAAATPPPKIKIPEAIVEQPEPEPAPAVAPPAPEPQPRAKRKKSRADTPYLLKLTTEFIANEIGWRTGHDLIYAACAHMTFAEKQKTWSEDEIDREIKVVNKFYKPFYSTNLDEYLQYLMKTDKLCRADNGEYELTPNTVKYLEERLTEEKLKKRMKS